MKAKHFKLIYSTLIGNTMEFYDFIVFAFMSNYLSKLFFTSSNSSVGLLYTFGVFASGYMTRPLGSLFFGYIGDKYGRKISLFYSVLLVTISTLAIGFLPVYSSVGILAPCLLVLCRLLQGFSVSGEEGGAAVYLYEMLDKGRAGFAGSLVLGSAYFGVLLGSIVCLILNKIFTPQEILTVAWRIPFLLSVVLGVLSLILRSNLLESKEFLQIKKPSNPLVTMLQEHKLDIFFQVIMLAALAVPIYVFTVFIPSYLINYVKMDAALSQSIATIGLVFLSLCVPLFGIIADKIGYGALFIWGCLINAFCAKFAFILMSSGIFYNVIIGFTLLGIPVFAIASSTFPLLMQTYNTSVRFSAVSMVFNSTMTIFGGATPMLCVALLNNTKNLTAPGTIVSITGIVGLSLYFIQYYLRDKFSQEEASYDSAIST